MKKALVLFPCDGPTRVRLEAVAHGRCALSYYDKTWTAHRLHGEMETVQVILGEPKNKDLRFCRNLEWVQSTSSGVNYYVNGGCFPENAVLSCMTGSYGNIISEHLLALVLSMCRRLPEYRDQQHARRWKILRYDKPLEESTLVILGAGDIGTTLAGWMRPMVGKVIGVRRRAREFPDCYDEMVTLDRLDEVLPQADVLLCILPHTPETAGLLDERRLALMKDDAILVNGGRGSLIDQEALCRQLDAGRFWGVGLEVTSPEPLPEDHPLWEQPRVIITPHAAGNSYAPGSPLEKKLWNFTIANFARFLDGMPVENQVDFALGYRL